MKVTKDKVEGGEAYLTVEMEPAEVEVAMEKAFRRLVNRTRVPGFRMGKAPRPLFERYFGTKNLLEEAIEDIVPETYDKVVKEQELEPISRPHIEITTTEPFVFKAVIPLKPVVKLGDYKSIKVPRKLPDEVTEEAVDNVIVQLQHQHATWDPMDRPAQMKDLLTLDVESHLEDGKQFMNQKNGQYELMEGLNFPAPNFAEGLVGANKGEEKELKLKLSADYPRKEIAEKEVTFKVKIVEIKQENLPEVTDKFAEEINPEIKTVAALRERIAAEMKERAEDRAKAEFEEEMMDALTKVTEATFPPILVDSEVHNIIDQRFRDSQQLDAYLQSINKKEEDLHTELEPAATKRVIRSLALGKLSEEEKIDVTEADVKAEIEATISKTAVEKQEELRNILNTQQALDSIQNSLLTQKTVKRLTEIVETEPEPRKEEPEKEAKEEKAKEKAKDKDEAKPKKKSSRKEEKEEK